MLQEQERQRPENPKMMHIYYPVVVSCSLSRDLQCPVSTTPEYYGAHCQRTHSLLKFCQSWFRSPVSEYCGAQHLRSRKNEAHAAPAHPLTERSKLWQLQNTSFSDVDQISLHSPSTYCRKQHQRRKSCFFLPRCSTDLLFHFEIIRRRLVDDHATKHQRRRCSRFESYRFAIRPEGGTKNAVLVVLPERSLCDASMITDAAILTRVATEGSTPSLGHCWHHDRRPRLSSSVWEYSQR